MSQAEEFFTELFLGSGAFLGLAIILIIMILAISLNKWASAFFVPLSIFMGIWYLENLPSNSSLMWNGIILLCTIPFQVIGVIARKGD